MSDNIYPAIPVFRIFFQELLYSKNSKKKLREPLTEAVNTYVSGRDEYQYLHSLGTNYLVIVNGLHTSRSCGFRPHYTLEGYNSQGALVSVIHVDESGLGEVFPPDANTLEKRRQRPIKLEI